ncbi:hypothetical protein AcW1_009381 [Taiwanofungus camphoratus]|nr:hypothetical protein AcV7_003940 [Antrodia cinnamomea]KAI0947682.1 hypothetical protein AcW1_009381 [Antrodia cinnamomea]
MCALQDINDIARDGGYTEYVTLRTEAVASITEDLDPIETAPLLCAGVTKLGGARLIVCAAPNAEVIQSLVGGLGMDGELLILALGGNATVPLVPFVSKRLNPHGWASGHANDSEDMSVFAKAHGIRVLVEKSPLDKAQEAYDRRAEARFRAVIVP